jgi:hypothetical protein
MAKKTRSQFHGLPPVKLCRDMAAWVGTAGIDESGRLLVEAGEDHYGNQYVSVIATAEALHPKVRRAISAKMIKLWKIFADGGPKPEGGKLL